MSVRRLFQLLLPLLLLFPVESFAQTSLDNEDDFMTRVSVGMDKKIVKGFHFTAEEEFRFEDASTAIDQFRTSLGLSYKINDHLKAGAKYILINPHGKHGFKEPRHRFSGELTGSWKAGLWNLSVKERLQMTHRTGEFNIYQNATNAWVLKSRIGARYKGLDGVTPYSFFEVRNTLNAPTVKAVYNEAKDSYYSTDGSTEAGWFINGWNGMYINRLRLGIGMEYKLSRRHGIDLFLLSDYYTDKSIDASKDGTELQSYTIQNGLNFTLGLAYTISF